MTLLWKSNVLYGNMAANYCKKHYCKKNLVLEAITSSLEVKELMTDTNKLNVKSRSVTFYEFVSY